MKSWIKYCALSLAACLVGTAALANDALCKITAVTTTATIKKGALTACKASKNKVACGIAKALETKVGETVAETTIEGVCKLFWKKDPQSGDAEIEIVPEAGKEKEVEATLPELKDKAPAIGWKLKK